MTTVLSIALIAVAVVAVPVSYWLGRRSSVDSAVNRALDKETRLPHINDQEQADRAEEGRDE